MSCDYCWPGNCCGGPNCAAIDGCAMMNARFEQIMQRAQDGTYGEDSELIAKLAGLVMAAKFELGWGPFICGVVGKELDGLHEAYIICPSYGADVGCSAVYISETVRARAKVGA